MGHGAHELVLDIHVLSSLLSHCLFSASTSMVNCILFYEVEDSDLFEILCCRSHI